MLLNDISPGSRMFKARYFGNESCITLSPNDVESILRKYADDDDDTGSEESSEWTTPKIKIIIPKVALQSPTAQTQISSYQISAMIGVRPVQPLNALLNAVQSEIAGLAFSHFGLNIFSWHLLRAVKEALDGDLREIHEPKQLEPENQLSFIVGFILIATLRRSRRAGALSRKQTDVITYRLFG